MKAMTNSPPAFFVRAGVCFGFILLPISNLFFAGPPGDTPAPTGDAFALVEGDCVVFVGGTNMVRGLRSGVLETLLTSSFRSQQPRFRDLAWEGDTVYFQSTVRERWRRDAFGGWLAQLDRVGASVVVAQFGQLESLAGEADLQRFRRAYAELLDRFAKRTQRLVLLSPTPFEAAAPPLPDLSERNEDLVRYVEVVRELAVERGLLFIDLFRPFLEGGHAVGALTSNGAHLTDDGHARVARTIAKGLGISMDDDLSLRRAIVEKHRLWYDYWRPANWKCLYGDDGERIFGKAAGDSVSFREEWKRFPTLIKDAEARVWEVANRDTVDAELASFTVPDDLEVNLFASEADGIVNPLAIRWDARGRLWAACTLVYPQIEPGARPNDRVVVLEDTDGDGRADRSVVFAEGLNIPTGMELGAGGVYIGQGTELLHLKDTDGDGRADERRVVLSGFGNGDSHQTINSFVWSPGGELFFCQGDGIESRVETPWGISKLFQAGVFRLRPRILQLGGLLNNFMGPGNPWGIVFDDWGQVVVADGAGGLSFLTPGLLATPHHLRLPRIGQPGGYCGVEMLSGEHLPARLRGTFVLGDYHKNRISRYALRPAGSGFGVDWKKPLLESTHRSFRPVDVRMGPDGALYIADWYNPVICHQDVSYRHPDRDRTHGRVWRLSAKGRAPLVKPALHDQALPQLLDNLKSKARSTRYQTKRVLDETDPAAAAAALRTWWRGLEPEEPGYEHHLFEALAAFETLEIPEPELLKRLLEARDHRARAYATRVVGRWHGALEGQFNLDPLDLLRPRATDEHPAVRMEAILSAAVVPMPESVEIVALAATQPKDQFIQYATTQAIRFLEPHWRSALKEGRLTFGSDVRRLAVVLQSVRSNDLLKELRQLARSEALSKESRLGILRVLVATGTAEDLRWILSREPYSVGSYDAELHATLLDALEEAAAVRAERPTGDVRDELAAAIATEGALRTAALRLAGAWGVDSTRDTLTEVARAPGASIVDRRAAVASLARLRGDADRALLVRLAADVNAPELVRGEAIAGLAELSPELAATHAADLLATTSSNNSPVLELVLRAFLRRDGGVPALAAALRKRAPSPGIAEHALQTLHSVGHADGPLASVLTEIVDGDGEDLEYRPELVEEFVREIETVGDAVRGEGVFRSRRANCYACHRIGSAGGWAGPDLSAVGTTLPADRLVEEVLWPQRHIKEGYTLTRVVTRTGEVLQGYPARSQSDRAAGTLALRTLDTGDVRRLARESLALREEGGSAMPAGIAAGLTRSELVDLLKFLSQLGRPGAYTVGAAGVVRAWDVGIGAPESLLSDDTVARVAEFDAFGASAGWQRHYARVSGEFVVGRTAAQAPESAPPKTLPGDVPKSATGLTLLRLDVDVTHAGSCVLRFDDADGLFVWRDGTAQACTTDVAFDFEVGSHRLFFLLDERRRVSRSLRAEWVTPPSGGRVRQGPELLPR